MSSEDGVRKGFRINRPEQSHVSTGNLVGLMHKIKTEAAAELDVPPGFPPKANFMPESSQISSSKLENRRKESHGKHKIKIEAAELDFPPGFPSKAQYSKEQQQQDHTEDGVCYGSVDRMTSEESKKQKLLESAARKKPVDQVSAPAGNALKKKLDFSSENSNIGGSETDLKHKDRRGFGNGVSYKRLMKGNALNSADGDASVPPIYPSKCNTTIASSSGAKDVGMESISSQAMQSNVRTPSKKVSFKAFVDKIPNNVTQNEGKSIQCVFKDSASELEARIFNLKTFLKGSASELEPRIPTNVTQNEGKDSISELEARIFNLKTILKDSASELEPRISKNSTSELEATLFYLETILTKYKSEKGLA